MAAAERELVTIFTGSMPEAMSLHAALRAEGFDAFLPDETIKTVDPFITGMNALSMRVAVPADQVEEAEEAIRELRAEKAEPSGTETEAAAPRDAEDAEDAAAEAPAPAGEAEVEKLASRVGWAFCLFPPLGVWLGIRYLLASARLERTARHHGRVLAILTICSIQTAIIVSLILSAFD